MQILRLQDLQCPSTDLAGRLTAATNETKCNDIITLRLLRAGVGDWEPRCQIGMACDQEALCVDMALMLLRRRRRQSSPFDCFDAELETGDELRLLRCRVGVNLVAELVVILRRRRRQ